METNLNELNGLSEALGEHRAVLRILEEIRKLNTEPDSIIRSTDFHLGYTQALIDISKAL